MTTLLVANVLRMEDERGGWKAADTSLWREHLHAATMFGRVAAARVAVQLGYDVVADDGPSGRLGQWAVAGVPAEVIEVHSKRTAEIAAESELLGYASYRAKGIIARDTRARKRHEPMGDLMSRWRAELESVGWRAPALRRSVDQAFERGPSPTADGRGPRCARRPDARPRRTPRRPQGVLSP